ncbi:hypothetical protein SPH9361_04554 [Sphingobium sp. CECT 9361]|nr:hypothetical protein SPH9361_04554 [Sphingobium sp. CECT 9361]
MFVLLDLLVGKPSSDAASWIARHDVVRLNVNSDDRSGRYNRAATNFYAAHNHPTEADPNIVGDVDCIAWMARQGWRVPNPRCTAYGHAKRSHVMVAAPNDANIVRDQDTIADPAIDLDRAEFADVNVIADVQPDNRTHVTE